ncbi:hypothetical protein D9758_009599 [Tetrapyrgos nigripes]|uniref:F-box domain-containing protein n=1 Tax=Tetrapyrgos nigripes TaxID=182062 RepID=A0A8H5GD31_9AGAR|nr:hypothetical protein D9758_009599 [Tetrapyrgos nigripes]
MLPSELTDAVIDCLQDYPSDLKTCSLVCHDWLPRARTNLFHDFTFPPHNSTLSSDPDSKKTKMAVKAVVDVMTNMIDLATKFDLGSPIPALVKNLTVDGRGSRVLLDIYNTGFLSQLPFTGLLHISIYHCDSETYAYTPSQRCLQRKSLEGLLEKNLHLKSLGIRRVWFERIDDLLGIVEDSTNVSHPHFRSLTLDTIDVVEMESGADLHVPLPISAWQNQGGVIGLNHAHGGAHAHVSTGLVHLPGSSTYLHISELKFLGNMPWLPIELLCTLANRLLDSSHPQDSDPEIAKPHSIGSVHTVSVFDVNTLDAYVGIFRTWGASISCLKVELRPVINDMHSPDAAKSFPVLDHVTHLELYTDIKTRKYDLKLEVFTSCMSKFLPHFPHLKKLSLVRVPASGHRDWRTARSSLSKTTSRLAWIEADTNHDQVLEDLSEAELQKALGLLRLSVKLEKSLKEILVELDERRSGMSFEYAIED